MPTTPPRPAEQLKREIDSFQTSLKELQDDVNLSSARSSFTELDGNIANLPMRIKKVRDRKYAFDKILESQALDFQRQWAQKRPLFLNQVTSETNTLKNQLRPLEFRITSLSSITATQIQASALKIELENFKNKVDAAARAATGIFDDIKNEAAKTDSLLDQIEKTLDFSESAVFGFLPGESVIRAVKAVWTRDQKEDKEDPDGILFLTDQRLVFEQREEVATKKVLFVTTERKKVQQLLFEVPVFSISNVKGTKQGVFKNEDWLDLQIDPGFFAREVKLHLDGQDCYGWQKWITRARSHELDSDRAIELDLAAMEKARSAPERCPYCGGSITKPVLRGMDYILCDFCGNKITL